MPETIKASEQNLKDIFSDQYFFEIPLYQRPYAWTTDQVDELLDDLLTSMDRDAQSPYFLGSIVLIKGEGDSTSTVVDGQQRITTLTMLLCVLRELTDDEDKADLHDFVREKGNRRRGTQDRFRLVLRERDKDFFQDNVQTEGGLSRFLNDDPVRFSDSQELIFKNVRRLNDELSKLSTSRRESLTDFVTNNCYLVVVTATNRDSAYRIFSVMNDRGLQLSPTDILKAETIGKISRTQQEAYGQKWEDIEEKIGRDDFRDLFAHIRMLTVKDKLRQTLQADFQDRILKGIEGIDFIDGTLEPYADIYEMVNGASFESTQGAELINEYLGHLGRLDNFDWIPPAMAFFRKHHHDTKAIITLPRIWSGWLMAFSYAVPTSPSA